MITGHVMQIFGIKSKLWFKVIKLYLAVKFESVKVIQRGQTLNKCGF